MGIDFDSTAVQHRLDEMNAKIHELAEHHIGQELHDWQVEDMKRKFPNEDDQSFLSKETTIWPRSRTYEQAHKGRPFKQQRRLSALPRLIGTLGKQPGARRPILRPELYERLVERMDALLTRVLTWR